MTKIFAKRLNRIYINSKSHISDSVFSQVHGLVFFSSQLDFFKEKVAASIEHTISKIESETLTTQPHYHRWQGDFKRIVSTRIDTFENLKFSES